MFVYEFNYTIGKPYTVRAICVLHLRTLLYSNWRKPGKFLLKKNDLPDVMCDATCLLFPHDLKRFLAITNEKDYKRLQRDIYNDGIRIGL